MKTTEKMTETALDRKVSIKCVPGSGRTEYTVYPNCSRTYTPVMDKYGRLVTGISKEDESRLGRALNQDLSVNSDFWREFRVVLTNKQETLDLAVPEDELKYLFLKTHKDVAASPKEVTPQTIFIMLNEEEEAKQENRKFLKKVNAYGYLNTMSTQERADFLKLFGFDTTRTSAEVIMNKLIQLAEDNPKKFVEVYEDGNKYWKIILENLQINKVITKNGPSFFFNEIMIGANTELAVEFLKDERNSDILTQLRKLLDPQYQVKELKNQVNTAKADAEFIKKVNQVDTTKADAEFIKKVNQVNAPD